MTRTEAKEKIKECLQKFNTEQEDVVSTLFNVYPDEMNEICRMIERETKVESTDSVIEFCNRVNNPDNNRCLNCGAKAGHPCEIVTQSN